MGSRPEGLHTVRRRRGTRTRDLGRWRKTLSHYIGLLRLAGVPEQLVKRVTSGALVRHRKVRTLPVPPIEALIYSRVLTYWRYEKRYLDARGEPLPLPLKGSLSFAALVHHAIQKPRLDPAQVADTLIRSGQVSKGKDGLLNLLGDSLIPKGSSQRHRRLGYALISIDSLVDTLHVTVNASRKSQTRNRIQRMVTAERLDPRHLAAYDKFQIATIEAFLDMHNSWLKRREDSSGPLRFLVGVNVNGLLLPFG